MPNVVDHGPLLPSGLAGARVALLRCPTLPQDEARISDLTPMSNPNRLANNAQVGRCGSVFDLTGACLSWIGRVIALTRLYFGPSTGHESPRYGTQPGIGWSGPVNNSTNRAVSARSSLLSLFQSKMRQASLRMMSELVQVVVGERRDAQTTVVAKDSRRVADHHKSLMSADVILI